MTYIFIISTILNGMFHEIEVYPFETEDACYEYAASAMNTFMAFGHQILSFECTTQRGA